MDPEENNGNPVLGDSHIDQESQVQHKLSSKEQYRRHLKRQYYRGVPVYPGQGGFNPCICCGCCCGGKCTLRTGCYLAAILLIKLGVIYGAYSLPRMVASHAEESVLLQPEEANDMIDFRTRFQLYLADIKTLLSYLTNSPLMSTLVFIWSLFFSILPGILLMAAAIKLSRVVCFVYLVLMILGVTFIIGASIAITTMTVTKEIPFINPDFKIWTIIGVWVGAYTVVSFRVYCLLCGYGLFAQLRDGEYNMPLPPQQPVYYLSIDRI